MLTRSLLYIVLHYGSYSFRQAWEWFTGLWMRALHAGLHADSNLMIDPFVCILKFLNYMYSTGRYKQEPENVRSYIIKIIILYYLDIYKFTLLLICVKKDSSKSVRTS